MQVNLLDIIVILFMTISAIFAFMDGIISELLGIVGWILALFTTKLLFPYIFSQIIKDVDPKYTSIISVIVYIAIFMVSVMICSYLTQKIRKLVHTSDFKIADKYLGLVFGIIRGFIFVVLFYIFIIWFMSDYEETPYWIANSKFRPYLINTSSKIISILPDIPTFEEIKFTIGNGQKSDNSGQNKITFEKVETNVDKRKLSDIEMRALQKTLKSLRDAEEIRQQFIKDKD